MDLYFIQRCQILHPLGKGFYQSQFHLKEVRDKVTPCPPLLFTLAFEPLIRALESDKSIIGYDVNGTILKTSAYADDLAFIHF